MLARAGRAVRQRRDPARRGDRRIRAAPTGVPDRARQGRRRSAPAPTATKAVLGVLADGTSTSATRLLDEDGGRWEYTARPTTACTVLAARQRGDRGHRAGTAAWPSTLAALGPLRQRPHNHRGEAEIALAAGHAGRAAAARHLRRLRRQPPRVRAVVAQTVLRVHSRVADLYNEPMNQTEQQLRLTVEALRERQEHELVNNRGFGLLHNADYEPADHTRTRPADPGRPGRTALPAARHRLLLAHPRAIAAIGRECTRRGALPGDRRHRRQPDPHLAGRAHLPLQQDPGHRRGAPPSSPCAPVRRTRASSACTRPACPDEIEPSLSVRFMGVDARRSCRTWSRPTTRPRSWCRTHSASWRTSRSAAGGTAGRQARGEAGRSRSFCVRIDDAVNTRLKW